MRIRIHGHEKLSAVDFGRVAAAYVRANNLEGYPVFDSKDGTFGFVLKQSPDEIERQKKEREELQRDWDRKILEMVKVEPVDAGNKNPEGVVL